MSRLSNWFSSLFSKPPHKNCVAKALECAKELKKRMPDAEVVTVTGLMLDKDDHRMPRFEKGKIQRHRMAAVAKYGMWRFYELQHGIPVRVPALEHWEPKRIVS